MRTTMVAGLMVLALAVLPSHANETLTTTERMQLQAAMQYSIYQKLVDGRYFYFDSKTASVATLYPAKAHPVIMQMGAHYILCSDFRDANGKPVNVDFYATRKGPGFVVFDTVVDDRASLEREVKAGRARLAK